MVRGFLRPPIDWMRLLPSISDDISQQRLLSIKTLAIPIPSVTMDRRRSAETPNGTGSIARHVQIDMTWTIHYVTDSAARCQRSQNDH